MDIDIKYFRKDKWLKTACQTFVHKMNDLSFVIFSANSIKDPLLLQ